MAHTEDCSECGEPTTQKDAFGRPLCVPCYDDEDDAVAAYEAAHEL
jgi:formylmethanofuran dehydrogenase subunit E